MASSLSEKARPQVACQEKAVCGQVQGCQLQQKRLEEEAGLSLQIQLPAPWSGLGLLGNPGYSQKQSSWVSAFQLFILYVSLVTVFTLQAFELWPEGVSNCWPQPSDGGRRERGWHPDHGWA